MDQTDGRGMEHEMHASASQPTEKSRKRLLNPFAAFAKLFGRRAGNRDKSIINENHLDKQREFWNVETLEEAMFDRIITDVYSSDMSPEEKNKLWEETAARHAMILLEDVSIPAGGSILEIGCGIGRLIKPMRKMGYKVDGIDISERMVEFSKPYLKDCSNGVVVLNKGYDMPFPDCSYDYVFSFLVFQHIRSVSVATNYFRETLRVLKSGGHFRIQVHGPVACGGTYREEAAPDVQYSFMGNSYTEKELEELLSSVGFSSITTRSHLEHPSWVWATCKKP